MSKIKIGITVLLLLVALVLIGLNLTGTHSETSQVVTDTGEPTYQSQHTVTLVYNPVGGLNYKLVAEHVQQFAVEQVTWFTRPVATMYDENKIATWTVRSDRAKLTNDKMLYLYGHVEVDSLTDTSQLQHIRTDNAVVNLVTQDVSSDDEVTLSGIGFSSKGMKMRGNLRKKTAELLDKVKTSYEIQNKK
ncbi:LPS export ABC transporter periplasmic protein LptC [Acerihabitans sp. TG2]|uniref:LPS export ABC transporter periplasmic protein LptC n=1 Tax=Acerihabitans sp. TG2 TaxID=3096008 RepID=UPI002B23D5EC|nr:LPS export ABC transporter periplasmic protein LptC [Acerihabitans sp. TG2]MEA9390345.1 LPS export ABC transporter periplasmic protein LptC [Acerihabitans sp. TG2]